VIRGVNAVRNIQAVMRVTLHQLWLSAVHKYCYSCEQRLPEISRTISVIEASV